MKIRPAAIIIPALLCLLGLVSGSVLVWRILFTAVFLAFLGFLWALINTRDIWIKPAGLPPFVHAGELLEKKTLVFNTNRLPKFMLDIREIFVPHGPDNRVSINLAPGDVYTWDSSVRFTRRGRYSLDTFRITSSDPFGLFSLKRTFGAPQNIFVYPRLVELPHFQPESHYQPEHGAGRWMRNETGTIVGRVREYTSGDTLNHVHWPSTAHAGNLMVKVFDPDRRRYFGGSTRVVMNMHREAYPAGDGGETADMAATIAASIIKKYTAAGKQLGLLASGDLQCNYPSITGNDQFTGAMESLSLIQPDGELPLDNFISQQQGQFEPDSIVIIITTSSDKSLAPALGELRHRRCVPIVIMLESAGFNARLSGAQTILPAETGDAPVFLIRKGDDITRTLDSRTLRTGRHTLKGYYHG